MNRRLHERIIMLMKQRMSFRSSRKFSKFSVTKHVERVDHTDINESTEFQCDCSNRRPPEVTTQNRKAEWFRNHRRP